MIDLLLIVRFTFDLENAVLYSFEIDINGRKYVGKCKEKGKAFDEYNDSLALGHGAYLLEQLGYPPSLMT